MVFVERQGWRQSPREKRKGVPEMALHYTLHYITCKDITIHVGNSTIAQSEDGVTRAYFPEDVSPECSKVGSEFNFKTSGNEVIITPDVAPKDGAPKSGKSDDGQTVFELPIGSFTLKVNGFTAKLKNSLLTEENVLTAKSDKFNQFFSYEERDDEVTIIVMPCGIKNRLKDLQEGNFIEFPGVSNVTYKVTKVERNKGWRTTVTIQTYKDGAPVGQPYTVSGDDNSLFVPSIPSRIEL